MRHQTRHKLPQLAPVAMLVAWMASSAAAADTVQLHYLGPAATLTTQVHLPLGTQSYLVGSYTLQTQSPTTSFQAYCIDPFQYASGTYLSYTRGSLASFLSASAQRLADTGSLFAHAYADSLTGAVKAAGFQLALWEAIADDRNLASGAVYATSRTSAAAVGEANRLLDALASANWTTAAANYDLTVYSNPQKQDFIAAAPALFPQTIPIPEPSAAAMLLAGLGLLATALAGRSSIRPPGA